ncbi:hypothetical protein PS2_023124 [Malus domestica]
MEFHGEIQISAVPRRCHFQKPNRFRRNRETELERRPCRTTELGRVQLCTAALTFFLRQFTDEPVGSADFRVYGTPAAC